MKPGLYENIPFQTYLNWEVMSQSTLKAGMNSMSHLKAALAGERTKVVTDAMQLGTALHCAFLEPELMPDKVVRWDGGTRRGEKWNGFCDEHEGKVILTPIMYEKLVGMVRSLRKHPEIKRWANVIETTELSAVGEVNGLLMKGRADALTPDPLFDLKKTTSTDPRAITNTVLSFGYHIQGAVYRQLFNRDRMILAFIEETPPYDVVPYELSPAFLRLGKKIVDELTTAYLACEKSDWWPGRSDDVVLIEPPDWAVSDAGGSAITLDGDLMRL